jgi:hypothetical protein
VESNYYTLTNAMVGMFDDDELVATPEMTTNDVSGWDSLTHVRVYLSVNTQMNSSGRPLSCWRAAAGH